MPEFSVNLNDVQIERRGDGSVFIVFNVRPEPVRLYFPDKDIAAQNLRQIAAMVERP